MKLVDDSKYQTDLFSDPIRGNDDWNEENNVFTTGIHLTGHGNAIEFHSCSKEEAMMMRDTVLSFITKLYQKSITKPAPPNTSKDVPHGTLRYCWACNKVGHRNMECHGPGTVNNFTEEQKSIIEEAARSLDKVDHFAMMKGGFQEYRRETELSRKLRSIIGSTLQKEPK